MSLVFAFVIFNASKLILIFLVPPFQSILRQADFKGAKLLGASFFDADSAVNRYRFPKFRNDAGADLSEADLRGADFLWQM
ncbi:hypothetical protein V6N11_047094 [Hibiscus sabdariffa]|uniref:Pentapeptide repeat-containing protein n=1 Tax=Hibiscus sabdariffa TaxID=183260 RepID=A0ABR2AD34_9ROSI